MGWTHHLQPGQRRKDFIAEITRGWSSEHYRVQCIRKTYRGAPWQGVLWALFERTEVATEQVADRFIVCFLIAYWRLGRRGEGWAYKDMSADMHPYYYSCPLSYVEMLTDDTSNCRAWARGVHAWWAAGRAGYRRHQRNNAARWFAAYAEDENDWRRAIPKWWAGKDKWGYTHVRSVEHVRRQIADLAQELYDEHQ